MRRALGVAIPALAAAVLALALALAVGRRDLVHFSLGGRAFELLRPSALYLLVGAPLAFTALRFSLVDLTRRQQWLSASLRALLIALLALALARPSTVGQRSTVATVLLVDVSDSISDRQLDDARKLIDEARATRRGDDVLRVVSFGKHPRALDLPPDGTPLAADFLARHDGDTSDLSAAVQLAYGLFPPGTLARAVLISDGNETAGNLAAEAFAARDRGVRVSYASFPAEQDDEVLVRSLELPADVKVGAPFEVTAQVYASRAVRSTGARSSSCAPAPTPCAGAPRSFSPASRRSRRCSAPSSKIISPPTIRRSRRWRCAASRACCTSRASRSRRRTSRTRCARSRSTSRRAARTACRRRRASWRATTWCCSPTCRRCSSGRRRWPRSRATCAISAAASSWRAARTASARAAIRARASSRSCRCASTWRRSATSRSSRWCWRSIARAR